MEIIIVCGLIVFVCFYNKTIDGKKFIADNEKFFQLLREKDYDFLVFSKYGDDVDCDELFKKRVMNGLLFGLLFFMIFLSNLSLINVVLALLIAFGVFKLPYIQLKNFYKSHLHEIDLLLPYYLKGLEILIQHYTVPVAINKSIETAPDIFKEGLRELVEKIEAGDSSVNPYMDFAKKYPVRDSMRMMRLLYRLSLGSQESKQQQLLMFSHNVSVLQNKAREQRYQERLEGMEKRTLIMLFGTGGIILALLMIAIFSMMSTSGLY